MKIVCTGLTPGLIARELITRGVEFISGDIHYEEIIRPKIERINPDVIIHTAANTNVDYCEHHPDQALRTNALGVNNIISWWEGKFIYLSTDHVFDGKSLVIRNGYLESHSPSPVNVYGQTKWAGERLALSGVSDTRIIRCSKIFSHDSLLDVVYDLDDGIGHEFSDLIRRSFVYDEHFVDGLLDAVYMFDDLPEILNLAGSDVISYATFWRFVCRVYGFDESLISIRKSKLKNATPRPFRAGLSTNLAERLGIRVYSALDGIKEMSELYYGTSELAVAL